MQLQLFGLSCLLVFLLGAVRRAETVETEALSAQVKDWELGLTRLRAAGKGNIPLTARWDHLFTAKAPTSRPRAAESEGLGVEGRLPLSFLETSPGNPSNSNLQPHMGAREGREGWNRRGFESQPCLYLAAATQLRPNSSEPHCSRLEDGDADVHPRTTLR